MLFISDYSNTAPIKYIPEYYSVPYVWDFDLFTNTNQMRVYCAYIDITIWINICMQTENSDYI